MRLTGSGLDRLDVPGDPRYSVDRSGRVFSSTDPARVVELKPTRRANGYFVVSIGSKQWKLHALVLTAWVGPRPPGMQCRHLDGNKANNAVDNLRWGTPKENGEDNVRLGAQPVGERSGARRHPERLARGDRSGARLHPETRARGENNGASKLDSEQVRELRQRSASGESLRELSRRFGVSRPVVKSIVNRETWKHVA